MIELREVVLVREKFQLGPISFKVEATQYAVLLGETGVGKSSLLEIIAGLQGVSQGEVLLRGEVVNAVRPAARGVGYVPQEAAIFPTMSVADNLAFGLSVRGLKADAEVHQLAEQLGLKELLKRRAINLSGGEARRVALGRALAFKPNILLLDEPLTGLDDATRERMQALLLAVKESRACTVLHVTHDRDEAHKLADVKLVLSLGSVQNPMNCSIPLDK